VAFLPTFRAQHEEKYHPGSRYRSNKSLNWIVDFALEGRQSRNTCSVWDTGKENSARGGDITYGIIHIELVCVS
jgi:hypothetical protein